MSIKWQRNYQLNIQLNDGSDLRIDYPLTLELNIVRKAWTSTNTATFRIRNLAPNSRSGIQRDYFDFTDFRYLTLKAGYGSQPWPIIFNGNVKQAYSWRESGAVDFITEIQGWDFGFSMVTGFSNTTLQGSQSKQQVVNTLVKNITGTVPSLSVGYMSQYDGFYPRGRVLFGPTWQILQQETGQNCYIDNGKIYSLKNNDVFIGGIPQINSSTGLLSTPRRAETYLTVEVLFEPNFVIGQLVELNSSTYPKYNGQYKILGVEHRGVISGAVNGKLTTTLFLRFGSGLFNNIVQQGLPSIGEGILG